MQKEFNDVLAFHQKFMLPRGQHPCVLDKDQLDFRVGFLNEELAEFQEAHRLGDMVEAVDGLLDLVYVACGTALFVGTPAVKSDNGGWPTFNDIAMGGDPLVVPNMDGIPKLLRPAVLNTVASGIQSKLDEFINFHQYALDDVHEPGMPLAAALESLGGICTWAYRAADMMCVPWYRCWHHVQTANMSKIRAARDGSDSKRGSGWDVVKPPKFLPPNGYIRGELLSLGWKP